MSGSVGTTTPPCRPRANRGRRAREVAELLQPGCGTQGSNSKRRGARCRARSPAAGNTGWMDAGNGARGFTPGAATAVDWLPQLASVQRCGRLPGSRGRGAVVSSAGPNVHQRAKDVPRQAGAALSLSDCHPDRANDAVRRTRKQFLVGPELFGNFHVEVWARRRGIWTWSGPRPQ